MSDPIVIVGPDGRGYVTLAEHERVRRKKALMTECLMGITRIMNGSVAEMEKEHPNLHEQWVQVAQLMNFMADGLEAENATIDTETRPAPLGD